MEEKLLELKISDRYFVLIRTGFKKYEFRLLDEELKNFIADFYAQNISHYLIFINDKDGRKIKVKFAVAKNDYIHQLFYREDTFNVVCKKAFIEEGTHAREDTLGTIMSFYPDIKLADEYVLFKILSVEEVR